MIVQTLLNSAQFINSAPFKKNQTFNIIVSIFYLTPSLNSVNFDPFLTLFDFFFYNFSDSFLTFSDFFSMSKMSSYCQVNVYF